MASLPEVPLPDGIPYTEDLAQAEIDSLAFLEDDFADYSPKCMTSYTAARAIQALPPGRAHVVTGRSMRLHDEWAAHLRHQGVTHL